MMLASTTAQADDYVPPHVRSDGSYVEGYYRSSPNSTTLDNYSHQGNTNPYTGERGTRSDNPSSGINTNGLSRQPYGNNLNPYGNPR